MTVNGERRIEYLPLDEIVPAARNPKRHADADLAASIDRWGYTEPVLLDERTGRLVAGHGRIEALQAARTRGDDPPEGVTVVDGTWQVPVVRGWASTSDREADAYLVASNRLTEAGGWDTEALRALLDDVRTSEPGLTGIGITDEDLAAMAATLTGPDRPGDSPTGPTYSRKADPIRYEPTADVPPPVGALVDRSRVNQLVREIEAAEDLPADVREFLIAGAQRHLVFNYGQIAEFYAHASPDVQRLMEASALVIIDVDDAILHGYVRLTDRLAALRAEAISDLEERRRERSA